MKRLFPPVTLTLFFNSCEKDGDMVNKNPNYTESKCEGVGF